MQGARGAGEDLQQCPLPFPPPLQPGSHCWRVPHCTRTCVAHCPPPIIAERCPIAPDPHFHPDPLLMSILSGTRAPTALGPPPLIAPGPPYCTHCTSVPYLYHRPPWHCAPHSPPHYIIAHHYHTGTRYPTASTPKYPITPHYITTPISP